MELGLYDQFRRLQPLASADDAPITLISVDEDDIRRFGHPLCDDLIAQAIETLLKAEPRVTGVDVYRDVPISQCGGTNANSFPRRTDIDLSEVVNRTDRVVMVMKFPDATGDWIDPPSFLKNFEQIGFSDVPVDRGGIVRRVLLFASDGDRQFSSFSALLAFRYLRDDGIVPLPDSEKADLLRLGRATLPPFLANDGGYVRADERGYQMLLSYRFGAGSFPTFPLRELLAESVPPNAIRDRILIVGTKSPSVTDYFFTPFGKGAEEHSAMYGIDIHAHAATQLIAIAEGRESLLASFPEAVEWLLILSVSVAGAALGFWSRSLVINVAVAVGGLAVLVVASFAGFIAGRWIPILPAGLAGVASASLATGLRAAGEHAERIKVRKLFSRFLTPRVAEEIWDQRDQFLDRDGSGLPRSRKGTLTVLISDLGGFTGAAENMGAEELMTWLNGYLEAMAILVDDHGGVVNDFMGDGIKADFGFPIPRTEEPAIIQDAANAVRCGLAMGKRIEELHQEWKMSDFPMPRLRIGILTGPVVVGAVGSDESLKYTSLGDTVNTASRLESFDKDGFGADPGESCWRILVGEETQRRLGDRFDTRFVGSHVLAGKATATRIYRVLGEDVPVRRELGERRIQRCI